MALLSSLWLTGCSVFGIREAAEPSYRVLARVHAIEIRRYDPRIAAETTVTASEETARSTGFRQIAGYIFGANHARAKIAMTAPVAQRRSGPGHSTIRFFMPAGSTLQTLPTPNNPQVILAPLPAETFAVLRFSGTPTPDAVAREDARLLHGLAGSGWSVAGAPVAWFYDPPWTLPPLRRNEVAVQVSDL